MKSAEKSLLRLLRRKFLEKRKSRAGKVRNGTAKPYLLRLCTFTALLRSTQPSTLRGTVK